MGAAKRSLPHHHGTGAFYRKVIALGSLPLTFVHVIIFGGRQKYVDHRAGFLNVFLFTGILQVSGCSFRDTLELTKHAESLGVAAIGGLTLS